MPNLTLPERQLLRSGYHNLKVLAWVTDNHFVGTIDQKNQWMRETHTEACYGYSNDSKKFFMYVIGNGQIQKIGVMKREAINEYSAKAY